MLRKVLFGCGVLILLALSLLLTGRSAGAHAILIRAEPADGAVVAVSPTKIQLWFNEAVVVRFSSVQLLDVQNQVIPGISVQADHSERDILHVTLPTLPPGGYTLFWKVLSDVDGHFSQGFTTLTIGQVAVVGHPVTPLVGGLSTFLEGGLRWVHYLLLTTLLGALAMVQFVLPTIQSQATTNAAVAQQGLRRRVLQWAAGCAGSAFLIGLGLLIWQLYTTQAAVMFQPTWQEQLWLLLSQTEWGTLWLVRQGLLLFLGGALWYLTRLSQEPHTAWPWLLIYGRVIELAIVQALAGHATSSGPHWLLALGNATLHLLAAGVWIGGLLTMGLILLSLRNHRPQDCHGWQPIRWRSFSLLAALSTSLLFATGLYSTGQQVASADALITTRYGQILIGKVMIVCFAGICGMGNMLIVHPGLAAWLQRRLGRPSGWRRLGNYRLLRLISLEAACGLLILGAAGLLTASAPPRGVDYTIAPEDIKPMLGQRVDDLIVTLEAKPNRIGRNLFNIRSISTKQATARIVRVSLNFTYLGEEQKPVLAIADEVEPNLYQVTGNYLTQAGPWQIDVITQRYGMADSIARFRWVAPPMSAAARTGGQTTSALQPVIVSKAPWAEQLTVVAVAIMVVTVSIVLASLYLLKHRRRPFTHNRQGWRRVRNTSSVTGESA